MYFVCELLYIEKEIENYDLRLTWFQFHLFLFYWNEHVNTTTTTSKTIQQTQFLLFLSSYSLFSLIVCCCCFCFFFCFVSFSHFSFYSTRLTQYNSIFILIFVVVVVTGLKLIRIAFYQLLVDRMLILFYFFTFPSIRLQNIYIIKIWFLENSNNNFHCRLWNIYFPISFCIFLFFFGGLLKWMNIILNSDWTKILN